MELYFYISKELRDNLNKFLNYKKEQMAKELTKKEGIVRVPVVSSNLVSIGHDGKKTLEVEFKGGSLWQYYPVDKNLWGELNVAESKGSFFHSKIKGNKDIKSLKIS